VILLRELAVEPLRQLGWIDRPVQELRKSHVPHIRVQQHARHYAQRKHAKEHGRELAGGKRGHGGQTLRDRGRFDQRKVFDLDVDVIVLMPHHRQGADGQDSRQRGQDGTPAHQVPDGGLLAFLPQRPGRFLPVTIPIRYLPVISLSVSPLFRQFTQVAPDAKQPHLDL
jgi:hypothetical protein